MYSHHAGFKREGKDRQRPTWTLDFRKDHFKHRKEKKRKEKKRKQVLGEFPSWLSG